MVGSMGERMLSIALPHVQAWNAWFTWFGNSVEGYRPMRDTVDAACLAVGRDPTEVERTVALFVAFPGALGRALGALQVAEGPPSPSAPAPQASATRAYPAPGGGACVGRPWLVWAAGTGKSSAGARAAGFGQAFSSGVSDRTAARASSSPATAAMRS